MTGDIGLGEAVSLLLMAAALAGCLYQIAATHLTRRFMARPVRPAARRPAVSVMKPLCGAEPGMAANLASCLDQDYPDFQLVFGVADPADPALAEVAALPRDRAAIDVVVESRAHGRNLKVGNLLNMWPHVRHDLVVIADSDIRVGRDYLDQVAAGFDDPGVGVVTCLYIGRPQDDVWSRLGALGINHGFLPSAVLARAIGRKDGCFGATMAVRRDVLERAGGLPRLADVLADDWVLGDMVRRQGLAIQLAARPVDIMVHEPGVKALLAHEIRWGRTIAAVDRPSYLASVVTQPVALALLAALAGGAWTPSLAVLGLAGLVRLWAVRSQERALNLPAAGVGLLALREILSLIVYVVASCGRTVIWRGRRFVVQRDGTLVLAEGSTP
ncbi:bacteriohopanetetrol glucosamine biosynthesis glycosyltransferase HpnI [Magnetospirillum sp. SS-4]|uniref:bacteriohopanetetrol glucosamine biosynthesis glycosyltransferase HpnI n=1 Tax=Magnetospirillum sp. SS-4 TaxID=2681465 RepID=UPI00137FD767|nr:bacteriohopanetetrol glucosamine biosynthesis glycosyltransferase HpnI [Magnetospirillum sp. SS-4]CAA7619911.1 Glycosyltransferase, probably involved in cell wall biogenesis [Magnetospirillum sp. SS-4]